MNRFTLILPLLFLSNSVFAANIDDDDAEDLLRDTIADTQACIVLNELKELPYTLDPENGKTRKINKLMGAFAEAGLLSKVKGRTKMMKNFGFSKRKVEVSTFTYSITDLGKEYYKENAVQISKANHIKPSKGSGFCYSDEIKITGITKNKNGYFDYYIQVPSKAEWAKHKAIESTGKVADKSWGNFRTPTIAGQAKPPKGLKVRAKISKLRNGDFALTHY